MNDSEGDSLNDDSAVRYLQPTPPRAPTQSPLLKESVSPLDNITAASARKEAANLKRKKRRNLPAPPASPATRSTKLAYTLGEVLGGPTPGSGPCTNLLQDRVRREGDRQGPLASAGEGLQGGLTSSIRCVSHTKT